MRSWRESLTTKVEAEDPWHALRAIAVIALIVATGLWGMVITFSDHPPEWSAARSFAYIATSHVPSGFLIGVFAPRRWILSVLVCWGTTFIYGLGIVSGALILVPPLAGLILVVLIAGYLGALTATLLGRWLNADIRRRKKSAA